MNLPRVHLHPWRPLLALFSASIAACSLIALGQESPPIPPLTQVDDSGIFEIFLAGRAVGSETFKIHAFAGKVEAQAEIHLRMQQQGKTVEVQSSSHLVLDPQLRPVTYAWSQKGPQSSGLDADFRDKLTRVRYMTVTGATDDREFDLPHDVLVLDDNVFYQYQLIAIKYQAMGGGRQTFRVFVPQEALPSSLTVEDMGNATSATEGVTANLRHLLITTDVTHIDLWFDAQQHIQRVSVPGVQLEAVRKS